MAFIPTANGIQVVLLQEALSNDVINVFNYLGTQPADTATLTEVCNDAAAAWTSYLRAMCPNNVTLIGVRATALDTASSPSVLLPVTASNVGTRAGTILPLNVACAVKHTTAQRGRSYRGRSFWYGLTASDAVNGELWSTAGVGALVTAVSNFVNAISANVAADVLTHVVLSLFSNLVPRSSGVGTPVTALSADTTIDSMRTRLEGRGS